jgi:hypothetical protein
MILGVNLLHLWVLAAAVGFVFAGLGLYEAVKDWLAIRPVHNGRRRLARVVIGKMTIKTLMTGGMLWLGVLYASQGVEPVLSVASVVLILVNVGIALVVVLDFYERRRTTSELTVLRLSGAKDRADASAVIARRDITITDRDVTITDRDGTIADMKEQQT